MVSTGSMGVRSFGSGPGIWAMGKRGEPAG
jgi:hypothetical protein